MCDGIMVWNNGEKKNQKGRGNVGKRVTVRWDRKEDGKKSQKGRRVGGIVMA